MELEQAVQAARNRHESTLVTLRSNGRPQLSNVLHAVGADGMIRISTGPRSPTCGGSPGRRCT
jgi:hypothetical protein